MKKRKYKRKQLIVDPEFQYGIIRKISFLSVLFIIMSMAFLTAVYYLYGDLQFELMQPDPFAESGSVDTLAAQRSLLDLLWPVMAACIVATLLITFLSGLIFSHRMAGPIFRIKRTVREIGEGNLHEHIRLRKRDDFKSLAEAINSLKDSLASVFRQLQDLSSKLESGDEQERSNAVQSLRRLISGFKTE